MGKIEWYKIEIPKLDGVYSCKVNGKKLCLIKQEDKITVTSGKCPHAGADLTQGWCEDGKLVCPFHRHKFDLTSGKGDKGQGNFIRIYETKIEQGVCFVALPKSWWSRIF